MSDGSNMSAAQHKRNAISSPPGIEKIQSNNQPKLPLDLIVQANSYFAPVSENTQSACPIITNISNQTEM